MNDIISAAEEYRREPVGINPPEMPIEGSRLRNPTGAPRLGGPTPADYFVRPLTAGDNVLQPRNAPRAFPTEPTDWTR